MVSSCFFCFFSLFVHLNVNVTKPAFVRLHPRNTRPLQVASLASQPGSCWRPLPHGLQGGRALVSSEDQCHLRLFLWCHSTRSSTCCRLPYDNQEDQRCRLEVGLGLQATLRGRFSSWTWTWGYFYWVWYRSQTGWTGVLI